MKYTWDKKILLKTLFNKQAREELSGLYLTYIGLQSLQDETHYVVRETLAYNSECFIANPFIEDVLIAFADKSHVDELPATRYKENFYKRTSNGSNSLFLRKFR